MRENSTGRVSDIDMVDIYTGSPTHERLCTVQWAVDLAIQRPSICDSIKICESSFSRKAQNPLKGTSDLQAHLGSTCHNLLNISSVPPDIKSSDNAKKPD